MNDFVLRGFCKKCLLPLEFNEKGRNFFILSKSATSNLRKCKPCVPVWFLSGKQMVIIRSSKSEELIVILRKYGLWRFDSSIYGILLAKNPFLVARILKEAGEKK
jgi:hypothetical protein